MNLSAQQRAQFKRDGFLIFPGRADGRITYSGSPWLAHTSKAMNAMKTIASSISTRPPDRSPMRTR